MDNEHAHSESFPMQLELSSCDTHQVPSRRPVAGGLIEAVAVSLLAHLLVALTVIFMPPVRASQNAQRVYLKIDLVDSADEAWGGADSGESETADGAFAGQHLAETITAPPEKTKAPVTIDMQKMAEKPKLLGPAKMKKRKPGVHRRKESNPDPGRTLAASNVTTSYNPQRGSQDTVNDPGEGTGNKSDKVFGPEQGAGGSAIGGNPYEVNSHPNQSPVSTVDKAPQPLQKYEPVYPDKARRLGISGKVVVKFVVESDGHVSRPSIQEADPRGIFEQSVLDTILRWRFKPGSLRGKPVATWVILPFEFQLT